MMIYLMNCMLLLNIDFSKFGRKDIITIKYRTVYNIYITNDRRSNKNANNYKKFDYDLRLKTFTIIKEENQF